MGGEGEEPSWAGDGQGGAEGQDHNRGKERTRTGFPVVSEAPGHPLRLHVPQAGRTHRPAGQGAGHVAPWPPATTSVPLPEPAQGPVGSSPGSPTSLEPGVSRGASESPCPPGAAVVRVTRAPVPQAKLLRPPPRTMVISLDSARGPGRPLVANGPGRRGHREGLASVRAWTLAPALPQLREGRAPGEGSWASLWGGGTGVSLRHGSPVSPTSSQRPEPHFPEKPRPRGHAPPAPHPATVGGDSVQVVPTVPDSQPQPATLPGGRHTLGLTPRGSAGPRRGEGPSPPQASLPGALPWGQPAPREGDKGG